MRQKVKRYSRSAISVLLTLCMLVSCMTVGIIATDAAKVTADEAVGADTIIVKGSWDNWQQHTMPYTKELAANTNYSFVYLVGSTQYANGATHTGSFSDYKMPKNSTTSNTLKTGAAGTYRFTTNGVDGDVLKVGVEYPVAVAENIWTITGDSTELFGAKWAPTATANDMTKQGSTTTFVWTKKNVSLSSGNIQYKVANNHTWDNTYSYPTDNLTVSVPTTGVYDAVATYENGSNKTLNLVLTKKTAHTFTVPSGSSAANATVTVNYNNTTYAEGQTFSAYEGETISVNITPDSGKQVDSLTPTGGATATGSKSKWTLTMPDADASFSITTSDAPPKRIYFNNNPTKYAMVSAYAAVVENGTVLEEPLGAWTGQTMTKLENSNIWYIDVPSYVNYITFIGDGGKNTGDIDFQTEVVANNQDMYTPGTGANSPAGGTWSTYTARTNEYTVTKGTTLTSGPYKDKLFTGISATFYDYYVDGEVTNGWLNIGDKEYSVQDGSKFNWNPYTKLNSALSQYAADNGVTYPLYFGNLNLNNISDVYDKNGTTNNAAMKTTIEGYTNWSSSTKANNSTYLGTGNASKAVTGLSGKTLAGSNVHYYDADASNENGAVMAMFDEDFLSGMNNQNTNLATILRTSSFPVRKRVEGGTTTYENKIYVLANGTDSTVNWEDQGAQIWVRFVNSSGNKISDVKMGKEGDYWTASIPSGATKISLVRMPNDYSETNNIDYSKKWNQAADIAVTTDTTSANRLYKVTSWDANTAPTRVDIAPSYGTTSGGHDYYQFNSTNGIDNAFITNIDTTNKTAQIDYYDQSEDKSVYSENPDGKQKAFMPFDFNHIGETGHDLGFGMKIEIPFTLNENGLNSDNTHQTFDFSGDDDLWVFIDNKLVLDLGGAHTRTEGQIDFNTKTITHNSVAMNTSNPASRNTSFEIDTTADGANIPHTMTIYYMERGMFDSNLKFGFSFHAIPNQYKAEKKVRTRNINSGFYNDNGLSGSVDTPGTASNKHTGMSESEGRFITKFENSYQSEVFDVEHTFSSDTKPYDGEEVIYSAGGTTESTTVANKKLEYHILNDKLSTFVGKFASGDTFTVKESARTGNRYVYDQSVTVYDDANNSLEFTSTNGTPAAGQLKDNGDGSYTFKFAETHPVQDLENLNIRARFTNQMKSHNLTIKKETNDPSDITTTFKLKILFRFNNDEDYISYPLNVTLNGVNTALNGDGTIDITSDQTLVIPKIPENAEIWVQEILPADSQYGLVGIAVTDASGSDVQTRTSYQNRATETVNVTDGVLFKMGETDQLATVTNNKYGLNITHTLHPDSPSGSGVTKVSAQIINASGQDVSGSGATYALGTVPISVDPSFIKRGSTNKVKVTLETEPAANFNFQGFYESIEQMRSLAQQGIIESVSEVTESGGKYSVTVVVPISVLFSGNQQVRDTLPFYSKLADSTKTFTIKKVVDVAENGATFPIKVEYSTDGGTTYYDLANAAYVIGSASGTTGQLSATGTANIGVGDANKLIITLVGAPANAIIRVTEATPTHYKAPTFTVSGGTGSEETNGIAVTSTATQNPEVTISNHIKTKDVTVKKEVEGGTTSQTFPIVVSYQSTDGTTVTTHNNETKNLAHNGTAVLSNVPVGSTITVSETAPGGYTLKSIASNSAVLSGTGPFTVNDVTGDATIIVTNSMLHNVYIDKVTNAEGDYTTNFKVRIQTSTDGGNTFADISNLTLDVIKKYGTSDATSSSVSNVSNEFTINKGDRIIVPNLATGTVVRVIETNYASDYYTFKEITGSGATLSDITDTSVTGYQRGKQFTVGTTDPTVTITNEFIPQTVKVTKKTYVRTSDHQYIDFAHDDGSKFTLHVTYRARGASEANYVELTSGKVSPTGQETPYQSVTDASQGNYVLQKNGYVLFENIPKGSYITVTEQTPGISPLTGEQRFSVEKLVNSTDETDYNATNLAANWIPVNGNLDLIQRNIVKMNTVTISKTTDSGDTDVAHTINIRAWDNGKSGFKYDGTNAHTDTIEINPIQFMRTPSGGTAAADSTNNGQITIHHGETIVLSYPVGTYFEMSETAGSLYSLYRVTADDTKMATSTGGVTIPTPVVNSSTGVVQFQMKDTPAEINYVNNRNKYSFTIKKTTDVDNTSDEFKVQVYTKETSSGTWALYSGDIATDKTGVTNGVRTAQGTNKEYTITKNETLTITGLKANSLVKVVESDVHSPKYALSGITGETGTTIISSGDNAGGVLIDGNKGVIVDNDIQTFTVTIEKEVENESGTPITDSTDFNININNGGTETPGVINKSEPKTVVLNNVPYGTDVTVTEPSLPRGYTLKNITGNGTVTGNKTITVTNTKLTTYDVTISKQADGNPGNKEFDITVSTANSITYSYSVNNAAAQSFTGTTNTYTLQNGQSVVLSGLLAGDQLTIEETNVGDDYTFEKFVVNGTDNTDATITYTVNSTGNNIVVHNKEAAKYQYEIKYIYESYSAKTYMDNTNLTDTNRVFGADRSYTQTGEISTDDLNTFFNKAADGTLSFKDGQRKNFISKFAPYEDDFMLSLVWDDKNPQAATYEAATKTIKLETRAASQSNRTVRVKFLLPYASDANLVPTDAEYLDVPLQTPLTTQYGNHVTNNSGNYVTAPLTLNDNGTTMYFQYWQIKSDYQNRDNSFTDADSKRCYYASFNMTMYQDSYVEAKYTETQTDYNPSAGSYADTVNGEARINFIETSRNQWNSDGGNSTDGAKKYAGDRVYVDFLLTFGYKDLELSTLNNTDLKTGFVLEQVAELDKEEGKYVTKKESVYASRYEGSAADKTAREAAVKTYIDNKTNSTYTDEMGTHTFKMNSTIALTTLDNKNQCKHSVDMASKTLNPDGVTLKESTLKNYVYRAYSYVKLANGTIQLSAPVYFTIYDVATIANGTNQ